MELDLVYGTFAAMPMNLCGHWSGRLRAAWVMGILDRECAFR